MNPAFDHIFGVLFPGLGWNQLAPHVPSRLIVHDWRNVLFWRRICSLRCCVLEMLDSQWLMLPSPSRVNWLDFPTDGDRCQRLYSLRRSLLLFESCHFSIFPVFEHLFVGGHASRRLVETTLALVALALDGGSPPSHLVFHAQRAAAMRDGLDTPGTLRVIEVIILLLLGGLVIPKKFIVDIFAIEWVASASWRFLLLNDLFVGLIILMTRFWSWLLLAKSRHIYQRWYSLCFLIFRRWCLVLHDVIVCLLRWWSLCLLRMFLQLELLCLTENLGQWLRYFVPHLLLALRVDRTGGHPRYIEYSLRFLQAVFSTVFSCIIFIFEGIIHRVRSLKRQQAINDGFGKAGRYTEIHCLVAQLLANSKFVHEGEVGDGVQVGHDFVLALLRLVHRVK